MSFGSRSCVALLVLVLTLLVPRDALALWGWIEQLSGPGPFWNSSEFLVGQLLCVANDTRSKRVVSIFNGESDARIECLTDRGASSKTVRAWVTAEFSFGRSDHNDLFGGQRDQDSLQVGYLGVKPLVFWRFSAFDVGAGVGFNHFSGRDVIGQPYDFWKTSIPVRVYITPARFLNDRLLNKYYWLQAFFYGEQVDFYPGGFNAADFHAPGTWESASPDVVNSRFVGLDILKLFGRPVRQP